MTKLIIQIPCYNEESTLPETLHSLPKHIPGIDQIEVLVIDDGSTDRTAAVALDHGVNHLVRFPQHVGLATAFAAGLNASLEHGADIIVNTDADNQYNAADIPKIIQPILEQRADIVIGDRGVANHPEFSPLKRFLQKWGSKVLALTSGLEIPDATSGFRAYSREAALKTIVLSGYTYTLETLIQAGSKGLAVQYVPVRTNPKKRPSRLIRSVPEYLALSAVTIVRSYAMYRALRFFTLIGGLFILGGLILGVRFLIIHYILRTGGGNLQSLLLMTILLIIGFQILLIGLLADLISFNRKILEEILFRLRKSDYSQKNSLNS
ncbi:MAG: glycosyltransferase family 2 protein [Anaerolineales bacterium]|nr:glycosyltransferase family 2 protein [Anaerolineales bacterium]MCS7247286.1 glycosyltransferase family 2 protein [Anaerolineales bacterium]MDW8161097.1 glycosyltransferase family 2 protein [Anaerolineales bacterium]MDW8447857.1 glycosyltransferase family 2 protein [Anaerolineales bacterium]